MKTFKLSILLTVTYAFIGIHFFHPSVSSAGDSSSITPSSTLANPKKKNKKKKEKQEDNQLSEKGRKLTPNAFPYPDSLKPAVEFWKKIYAEYDKNHSVIHDTRYFVIYSVVDANKLEDESSEGDLEIKPISRKGKIAEEKKRILEILNFLAAGGYDPKELKGEEARIYHLFDSISDPNKFSIAADADRIRSQRGQKDKFLDAIPASGKYLTEIEDILISKGVPWEISRLPFVESMFNLKARSSVGASGIWQFMPYTGKLYMTVNGQIDERNDPIEATYGAAALLKDNYDQLGNWALAINAYNSGLQTLMNAKAATGTDDIGVIIQNYEGGVYKFASRNFYPCFLAVLEISNHYKNYFGDLPRDPKMSYESISVDIPLRLNELTTITGLSLETLREMNPAYHSSFFYSKKEFPLGKSLKVPKESKEKFIQAMKDIQANKNMITSNSAEASSMTAGN